MRRVPSILLMTALLLAWPLVASAGVQAPGAAAPTAAAGLRADFNGDGAADLVIGVPGENLNVGFGSGVVHALPGSAAGLTATGSQLWSQDSPGVAGAPEFLDFFGQTLAASVPGGAGGATGVGAATGGQPTRPAPQQRR